MSRSERSGTRRRIHMPTARTAKTARQMEAACRRFNDLVADLHARMGVRAPDGPAPGQPVPVDIEWRGVRFRMALAPALDADALVVQCFYGTPLHGQVPVQ